MRFYNEELLTPRPNPKLQDHPFSAVHDILFNIFAATIYIAGRSSFRSLCAHHAALTGTALEVGCGVWIGLIWLGIGTSGGHTFGLHKMLENS
jgi:hypothetical protein